MEDILEVYTRVYDPERPQVCMDESSKQLLDDPCPPLPVQPGQPERIDYHYQREGTANLFMFFEPLGGKRYLRVTDRRTKVDWAEAMREVADVHYPEAKKIVVVMDNLNTHTPSSFYEAFAPQEARRLVERFEFHYTPKHGSWLNMAEIELNVLIKQCLDRRIDTITEVQAEAAAWENRRNNMKATINWQFTCGDARIKLRRLYPTLDA